jgi:outer membrane porin, OprD family
MWVAMFLNWFPAVAQDSIPVIPQHIASEKNQQQEDTTNLLHAFKKGSFHGHFRYFFMHTDNKKGLTDYYANAAGGGIRYETARFHGFSFALSGFFIFNAGSSNFSKPDSTTGQYNRYEIALFDTEDPLNKKDINRLEEFQLTYNHRNSKVIFGRQLLNTPFINLQDGRMRPTVVEGLWLESAPSKKLKLEGGWLYAISPRATTRWYSVATSIGVYSQGLHIDGSRADYANNLTSRGVLMMGGHYTAGTLLKLQAWNVFTENIFNTAMLQADLSFPLKKSQSLFAAAQVIRQDAVNSGGNPDPAKAYLEKGGKSLSFGMRVGWKNRLWEATMSYNRITRHGRYLMPREWGREPFFTFLQRERNEGFGDVHAAMARIDRSIPGKRMKISLAAGYYQLPDIKNFRLNKYSLPSYWHINSDIHYTFTGKLKGFEMQLLLVAKLRAGETYGNKKYEFNKVNMVQYNFILNYHF